MITETNSLFREELKELLKKYRAIIRAENCYMGHLECGEDICINIEFEDYTIGDIKFGCYIDTDEVCNGG